MATNEDGYCEHGTYVGGIGIDWMCGWCESGISDEEYAEYVREERAKREPISTDADLLATVVAALIRETGGMTPDQYSAVLLWTVADGKTVARALGEHHTAEALSDLQGYIEGLDVYDLGEGGVERMAAWERALAAVTK